MILSTYAVGASPLTFERLLSRAGGGLEGGDVVARELALLEGGGDRLLPAGFCARWGRGIVLPPTIVWRRPMTGLEVLHVSNHVLCVVKPACVPTVPDDSGDPSMVDLAKAWIGEEFGKPGAVFLGVVHRLDRPVSGVLAFARTSKGAARLTRSSTTVWPGRPTWRSRATLPKAGPRARCASGS